MSEIHSIPLHRSKELQKAELVIAYVLRYGVLISALVICAGLLLRFTSLSPTTEGAQALLGRVLHGQIDQSYQVVASVHAFWEGIIALDSDSVIALGLILLIALPIIRVGLTIFIFLFEKDRIYLFITAFVFIVLLSGIFLGKGG